MQKPGFFLVFESAAKCGKSTLATGLTRYLESKKHEILHKRGALSNSEFSRQIKLQNICDLGYSSAFYWADCIFDTNDTVKPAITSGKFVLQERYDLSILTFREIHGLKSDFILLDEYLERHLLISPDLTVLLKADPRSVLNRIRNSADSSEIDLIFLSRPDLVTAMNERLEYHLNRLGRKYITLDTVANTVSDCQQKIISVLQEYGDNYEK